MEENSKEWNELYDKLYTIDGLFQKLYDLTNDIPEVKYSNTPRRLNNASIAMYLTSFISIVILPFTKYWSAISAIAGVVLGKILGKASVNKYKKEATKWNETWEEYKKDHNTQYYDVFEKLYNQIDEMRDDFHSKFYLWLGD